MRRLHFTTGSPFARGVRIVLDEIGLDYERAEEITTPTAAERARVSPTLQVPTLVDGDLTLWESGLIATYLMETYPQRTGSPPLAAQAWRPHRAWQDRRLLATVQTLGQAVTTISQMTWSGVPFTEAAHLTRSAEKIGHLLTWLEGELAGPGSFEGAVSVQEVFLVCHLTFAAMRPLGLDTDLARWPTVAGLVERLEARPSFRANPCLWWEPGVTGYTPEGTPLYAPGKGPKSA